MGTFDESTTWEEVMKMFMMFPGRGRSKQELARLGSFYHMESANQLFYQEFQQTQKVFEGPYMVT